MGDFQLGFHIETLPEALRITAVGFGMVFAILILICLVLYAFNAINKVIDNKAKALENGAKENTALEAVSAAAPITSESVQQEAAVDDKELIAVIAAAIAASANVSPDKLVIRSVRRVNRRSKWQGEAISEQQIGLF